jgi:hypothetical protein
VLEIHSPGAGRLAMKLTGTKVISNPTLVVHGKSGLEIYSGGVAVEDALKPFSGIDSPLSQGRIAIIALACIVLVFTIIGDEIGFFSSLNAFLGLVVVGGLWSHCLHCYVGGTSFSAYAPVAAVLYCVAGAVLFTLTGPRKRALYIIFMIVSAFVPIAQSYLIAFEPKLCPLCLIVTAISVSYFSASLKVLVEGSIHGLSAPLWMRYVVAVGLPLMLFRHLLLLGGYVSDGYTPPAEVQNIVGTPLNRYIGKAENERPGILWLVTLPGCEACAKAEAGLSRSPIIWRSIGTCSAAVSEPCFDSHSGNFPAPMIIIANKSGDIVFQREGWVSLPGEKVALLTQALQIQKREQQP